MIIDRYAKDKYINEESVGPKQLAIYPYGTDAQSGMAAWRLLSEKETVIEKDSLNTQYDYAKLTSRTEYELQIPKGSKSTLSVKELCGKNFEYMPKLAKTKETFSMSVFSAEGRARIDFDDSNVYEIEEGECLVFTFEKDDEIRGFDISGEGTFIISEIDFTFEPNVETAKESAKGGFDDFKKCVFIANTQFRWAKFLFKSLKSTWYDEALTKAIWKIERFYVTMFAMIIGLGAILIAGAKLATWPVTFGIAAVWVIVFQLLIAPLIYFAVVPKPVASHIKHVDDLNQYERNIYESTKNKDQHMEHLMNKYKKPALKREKVDEEK